MNNVLLKNVNLNDDFFDSLRYEYLDFNNWFIKKANLGFSCFVNYKDNNIASICIIKFEYEDEDYSMFKIPFEKNKRIKICTLKVNDKGKKIGSKYLKLVRSIAIKNNINEIYITLFDNHKDLIELLESFNYKLVTYKDTIKCDKKMYKELVFVCHIN